MQSNDGNLRNTARETLSTLGANRLTKEKLARPLPAITEMNDYFWRSGSKGHLHILCCTDCGIYAHPYVARCSACRSKNMAPKAVSGIAVVCGFTINHQPWYPHVPTPYVIAYVELVEQRNIRLATNIVNCPVEDVVIGMPVKVLFEQYDDIFVPVFEPA